MNVKTAAQPPSPKCASCHAGSGEELTASSATSENAPGPYWGVWAQPHFGSQTLSQDALLSSVREPAAPLKLETTYDVYVDLSKTRLKGADSRLISSLFRDALDKAENGKVNVEVVAVADRRYFQLDDSVSAVEIPVDLSLVRDDRPSNTSSDFQSLVRASSLGIARFTLATLSQPGRGSIALSFWINHTPVDEMTASFCVGSEEDCPMGSWTTNHAKSGLLGGVGSPPDAALHLLELSPHGTLVGVFYCRVCEKPRYIAWRSRLTADRLVREINNEVIPLFQIGADISRPDTHSIRRAGDALYSLLFRSGDDRSSDIAEAEYKQFVARAQPVAGSSSTALRVFARILPRADDMLLIPLNLMHSPGYSDGEGYLGFEALVESPLPLQSYERPAECIKKWVFVVPPLGRKNSTLSESRAKFEPWLLRLQSAGSAVKVLDGGAPRTVQDWFAEESPSDAALVTFSHHTAGRLCWSDEECLEPDSVVASLVDRQFKSPSFALVNGCGSAGIGATDLIAKLNEKKVDAIIATATTVDTQMAAVFLSKFLDQLYEHRNEAAYTVSSARFDAAKALATASLGSETYGLRALNYMSLGDGFIKACLPMN